MAAILAIDAAWAVRQPSGVALACNAGDTWHCVGLELSYIQFEHLAAGDPGDSSSKPTTPRRLPSAARWRAGVAHRDGHAVKSRADHSATCGGRCGIESGRCCGLPEARLLAVVTPTSPGRRGSVPPASGPYRVRSVAMLCMRNRTCTSPFRLGLGDKLFCPGGSAVAASLPSAKRHRAHND